MKEAFWRGLNYDSDNHIPHLSIRITVNTGDQGSVASSRTQVIGPTCSTKPQVPGWASLIQINNNEKFPKRLESPQISCEGLECIGEPTRRSFHHHQHHYYIYFFWRSDGNLHNTDWPAITLQPDKEKSWLKARSTSSTGISTFAKPWIFPNFFL